MKKLRVAVIGLGIFGKQTCLSLVKRNVSVLAIDQDRELVEELKDQVDQALILDTTSEKALEEARVNEVDVAVCAIGSQHVEDSIMTTALLHKLNVPRIVARAGTPLHARILQQVGAHDVINPEEAMAERTAFRIASPSLKEILPLAEDIFVAEIPVPESFVGRSLRDLNVRREYNLNVIGVQRLNRPKKVTSKDPEQQKQGADERTLLLNISPSDSFLKDDHMLVIGKDSDVTRLSRTN